MSVVNDTKFKFAMFMLTGIPGLEDVYIWISISFCIMYVISIVGNSAILFIIKTDPSLHEPMYIFLSMLAVTDLALSISTIPTILSLFLFNVREISLNACFAQLFFICLFQCIESSVLLLMAFDSFTAICKPLRYASILTLARIAKMGLACVLRGVAVIFPLPILLKRFRYCQANVLSHSYCLHQEVMKMACSDITDNSIYVNRLYGLVIVVLVIGLDLTLIALSYGLIIRAVLRISSKKAHQKTLNTCTAHIFVMLTSYTPFLVSSLTHRFSQGFAPHVHIILANLHLLVPPMLNPIIYGVKTKELSDKMFKYACRM
uniref:G-protein coupled receptors family 1 profile domain-containing protein n=1 Tax=Gopherus evgoodei TaxID=1825980 RepID=A0A8C4VFR0_9SAUR